MEIGLNNRLEIIKNWDNEKRRALIRVRLFIIILINKNP
jgi:hypothetical protein